MNKSKEIQLIQLTEAAWKSGDLIYAKKLLLELIKLNEYHARANELLAYLVGNQGDRDGAVKYLLIATQNSSCSIQAAYELGSLYLQDGEFQKSIEYFKKAILQGGNFFELYHDLALAQGGIGFIAEGVISMERAIELSPNSSEAHYNLGRLYDDLNYFEKSLNSYQNALSYNPFFLEAQINKGVALYELNHPERALLCYEESLKISSKSLDALLNQGMAFHALNRYQEAKQSYDRALEINSAFAKALWNKSLVQLTLGELEEGWKNYESRFQAVKSNQQQFEYIPSLDSLDQIKGARS